MHSLEDTNEQRNGPFPPGKDMSWSVAELDENSVASTLHFNLMSSHEHDSMSNGDGSEHNIYVVS